MSDLSLKTCEACRPDAPKATYDEISSFLSSYPDWTFMTVEGVQQLQRIYNFDSFHKHFDGMARFSVRCFALVGP